jgi:hypothetical protein
MANAALPTVGLVASYPFDGNSRDSSGNGNDAIVVGATLTQDRFGVNASAFHFDGINQYMVVLGPKSLPLANSARTITAWVRPEAASGTLAMVSRAMASVLDACSGWYFNTGLYFWGGVKTTARRLTCPLGKWSFVAVMTLTSSSVC